MPEWTCAKCGKKEQVFDWKAPPWKGHRCRRSVMETPILPQPSPPERDEYLERQDRAKAYAAQEFTQKWGKFLK